MCCVYVVPEGCEVLYSYALNLPNNSAINFYHYPHFTDVDTEALRFFKYLVQGLWGREGSLKRLKDGDLGDPGIGNQGD